MMCEECGKPVPWFRKFCSRACYHRWRTGRPGHRKRQKPLNYWHAEHMRVMDALQAQRPSAQKAAAA